MFEHQQFTVLSTIGVNNRNDDFNHKTNFESRISINFSYLVVFKNLRFNSNDFFTTLSIPSSFFLCCSFTAMVVRFITRRFIGEYDSSERVYTFNTTIDNEIVHFEILDSTGHLVIVVYKHHHLTNSLIR